MSSPRKRCKDCGEVKPLEDFYRCNRSKGGRKSDCKVCRRASVKAYADRNREAVRESNRRYYHSLTPDQREADKQRLMAYRQSARGKAYQRAYYQRNKTGAVTRARAWQAANREQYARTKLEATRRRRARLGSHKLTGFSRTQLAAKAAYWGDRCWRCKGEWDQFDHVKPLAKGGPHLLANLRPICGPCNRDKGTAWPIPHLLRR